MIHTRGVTIQLVCSVPQFLDYSFGLVGLFCMRSKKSYNIIIQNSLFILLSSNNLMCLRLLVCWIMSYK